MEQNTNILLITRNSKVDQLAMLRQHLRAFTARTARDIGKCVVRTLDDMEHSRIQAEERFELRLRERRAARYN